MADASINLLRTKSLLSSTELTLLAKLRLFSTIGLVLVLVIGSLTGVAFLVANLQLNAITNQIAVTKRKITLANRKEVLLTTIKNRIPALEKNMASQYPWDSILSMVNDITKAPILQSVSVNERNELSLSVTVSQLEEVETMLASISDLFIAGKLKDPELKSLQINEKGQLVASIVITPVF